MSSIEEIDRINREAQLRYRDKSGDTLKLAEEACRMATQIGYRRGYTHGLLNHGRALMLQGGYHEAIALIRHALSMAEENGFPSIAADALQETARAYYSIAEYDSALECWTRCLDAASQIEAHDTWLQALVGLGQIYYAHGDFESALTHHRWAVNSWQTEDGLRLKSVAGINVGINLYQLGRLDEALDVLQTALEEARMTPSLECEGDALGIIGLIRLARNELELADFALMEALAINNQRKHVWGVATNLLSLGKLRVLSADLEGAERMLHEALLMAEAMSAPHLAWQAELALAELYEAQSQWEQALLHFKQYHFLQSETRHQASPERLQVMEMRIEIERARIENSRLRRMQANERRERSRFEQLASEDPLTGLLNRRGFEVQAEQLFPELIRLQTPVCVLMIDIDHFKSVNDGWGHELGDKVLRQVAALLKSGCRQHDLVARWGGEEFVVLLRGRDGQGGLEVAERLRLLVAGWSWAQIHPALATTISIGVAARVDETVLPPLLGRADEQLYRAKKAGRNTVSG
jgi:diguanylate cyclase (GGDEF)-like protein